MMKDDDLRENCKCKKRGRKRKDIREIGWETVQTMLTAAVKSACVVEGIKAIARRIFRKYNRNGSD